jgi:hypothetical protein
MIPALVLLFATFSSAQRKGAIATGGALSFQSLSSSDSSGSFLNLEWNISYYLGHNSFVEVEPLINFEFNDNNTNVSTILLGSAAYRIFDMAPNIQYRTRIHRKRDYGIVAGVYITGGLGLWIDGSSRRGRAAPTYTGTALSAGITSHSVMGNQTLMRVQAKIIHLLPSGPIYDISRTIIQVGVGFSIFMRL